MRASSTTKRRRSRLSKRNQFRERGRPRRLPGGLTSPATATSILPPSNHLPPSPTEITKNRQTEDDATQQIPPCKALLQNHRKTAKNNTLSKLTKPLQRCTTAIRTVHSEQKSRERTLARFFAPMILPYTFTTQQYCVQWYLYISPPNANSPTSSPQPPPPTTTLTSKQSWFILSECSIRQSVDSSSSHSSPAAIHRDLKANGEKQPEPKWFSNSYMINIDTVVLG